jgi:hypothetical protein
VLKRPEICEISGADGRPGVLLMKLSAITPAFSVALDVIINFLVLTLCGALSFD